MFSTIKFLLSRVFCKASRKKNKNLMMRMMRMMLMKTMTIGQSKVIHIGGVSKRAMKFPLEY